MKTCPMIAAILALSGAAASADTLVCGTAFTSGARGTMIDLRNDSTSPIRLDSLDFIYWTGNTAPSSYNVTFQAYTSPGGWTPNQSLPANWTLIGEHTYDLEGPSGSTEHFELDGFVINPGETVGFAFFSLVPSVTQSVRSATLELNAPGPYTNGDLTAVPGAVLSNTSFTPNAIGIGLRMYSGSINYTLLSGGKCYANCDGSTTIPILNVNDFVCFQQAFAAGDTYANCDNSTTIPVLNVNDFVCFQQAFAAGCP